MNQDLIDCHKPYFERYLKSPTELKTSWTDLVGRDDVMSNVFQATFAKTVTRFPVFMEWHNVLLLVGAPGAGKHALAQGLATLYKYNFLRVCFDELNANHFCDARDKLIAVFEVVKKSLPCILFLDEAELMFEDNNKDVPWILSSTFRTQVKNIDSGIDPAAVKRLIIIVSSNNPTKMDSRVWNKLIWHIHVPELTREERSQILKTFEVFADMSMEDRNRLLDAIKGFGYGDIKMLVKNIYFEKHFRNITSLDIIALAKRTVTLLQMKDQRNSVRICRNFYKERCHQQFDSNKLEKPKSDKNEERPRCSIL